jgi:hypothetical protein
MSGTVVDLAEPQSIHLVTPDDREDVYVNDEHQQQRCEEQEREHRTELEVYHEAENRVRHFLTLITFSYRSHNNDDGWSSIPARGKIFLS